LASFNPLAASYHHLIFIVANIDLPFEPKTECQLVARLSNLNSLQSQLEPITNWSLQFGGGMCSWIIPKRWLFNYGIHSFSFMVPPHPVTAGCSAKQRKGPFQRGDEKRFEGGLVKNQDRDALYMSCTRNNQHCSIAILYSLTSLTQAKRPL
jgi:hypothetical protein